MNKKRILALVVFLTFSAAAIAQEDYSTENGIYISAQGTLMQFVQPLGPPLPNFEDTASVATLLVGYRMLGGRLAVEVGATDDLTFHETISSVVPNAFLDFNIETNTLRALWRFVGRGDASFIVGAGYNDLTSTLTVRQGALSESSSDDSSERSLLVGGEIDGPALTIRFAYEQFINLDDEARNRAITFGVGYRF
jgi:hypothetical protein